MINASVAVLPCNVSKGGSTCWRKTARSEGETEGASPPQTTHTHTPAHQYLLVAPPLLLAFLPGLTPALTPTASQLTHTPPTILTRMYLFVVLAPLFLPH